MRRSFRHAVLVCVLSALLVAALPASASAGVSRMSAPAGKALHGLRRLSVQAEDAQYKDLPFGGLVRDSVTSAESGNNTDIWGMGCYAGQHVEISVSGAPSTRIGILLFRLHVTDSTAEPEIVGQSSGYGYPQTISYDVPAMDVYWIVVGGLSGSGKYTLAYAIGDPPVATDVTRLAGPNRWSTSVSLSQASFPGTATAVVVATGMGFADALAGSSLCGSYDAPLLLVKQNQIPADVLAEVDRLQPERVFVLGGTGSVSAGVETQLAGPGRTVKRLQGKTRFDTAVAIAREIKDHETAEGRAFSAKAFVVPGMKYADALSVSPFAFTQKAPILLANETSATAAKNAMKSLGMSQAYIIGNGITETTKNSLPGTKTRIAGGTRIETSVNLAAYGVGKGWGKWSTVGLTNGYNYPDALAGGVYCGKNDGVMMLTYWMYLDEAPALAIDDNVAAISRVRLFGGPNSISGCVMGDADSVLKGTAP